MDKEAEAAAAKANVIAARKRAEQMAAEARGDVPKVSQLLRRSKSKRRFCLMAKSTSVTPQS